MNQEEKNKTISGGITILCMALVVVVCLAFGYDPPDPPIPEEGVEVNLGNSDFGLGNNPMPEAHRIHHPHQHLRPSFHRQDRQHHSHHYQARAPERARNQ